MARTLQIGVSKPSADTTPEQEHASFEHKVAVVTGVIEKSVKRVGMVVCAYVVLDTVRQVVVKAVELER